MSNIRHQPHKEGIHRRALLLGGVGLLGMGVLGGRLYQLQFIQGSKYRHLAEGNRISVKIIGPERGLILDRVGQALAENKPEYRLYLDMDRHPAPKEVLLKLRDWIGLSDAQYERILLAMRTIGRRPLLVKKSLSWEEVVKVEHHIAELPGVYIDTGQQRAYPLSEEAAHVIGYIGKVTADEQQASDDYYRWPEAMIGKQGLEKVAEQQLRGQPGHRQLEVDAHGLTVQPLAESSATAGEALQTTLHAGLQRYVHEKLSIARSGAAVVMDVHSGEVLALASAPAFDSTTMSRGIDPKSWQALRQDSLAPLLNKAIAGQYPPGSTFKMVVALAALHAGITPWRRVYCPGHFTLGRQRFRCWKQGGHGWVDLHHAIAESCDTYFYSMGNEIGMDAIAEMGALFGLGQPTNVGLPAEKAGIMPNSEWKLRNLKQKWQGGDTINASIGQGYVLTTPLQLAQMTARLVNGGYPVVPRLLPPGSLLANMNMEEGTAPPETGGEGSPMMVNKNHLDILTRAMEAVVNARYGTAYATRNKEKPLFAGKTGTAQVRRIVKQNQNQDELPWEHRHHALFTGFAPVEKPRFAVSVVLEHGGSSSKAAAVAGQILDHTLELMHAS